MYQRKQDFRFLLLFVILFSIAVLSGAYTSAAEAPNIDASRYTRVHSIAPIKPLPVVSTSLFNAQAELLKQVLKVFDLIKSGAEWDEIKQKVPSAITFKGYTFKIDWQKSFSEAGDVYLRLNVDIPPEESVDGVLHRECYMRITTDLINFTSLAQAHVWVQGKMSNSVFYQILDAQSIVPFINKTNAQKAALYSFGGNFFLYASVEKDKQGRGITVLVWDRKSSKIIIGDLSNDLETWQINPTAKERLQAAFASKYTGIPQNVIIFTNGPEFNSQFGGKSYDAFKITSFISDALERKVRIAYDPGMAVKNLEKQVSIREQPGDEAQVSFIFNENYFDMEQPEVVDMVKTMKEQIQHNPNKPMPSLEEQITQSQSNILIITAHRTEDFIDELKRIGENGNLREKFLVLNVCAEKHASEELVYKLVRKYHATGVMFYRKVIHLEAVSLVMEEMRKLIQEPKSSIGKKMDEIVEEAIQKAIEKAQENLRSKIQGLDKPFKQYSMHSEMNLKEAA